ncbi:NAD-dependent protein deacylase [Peptococcus simiae]|uniref:NAD-dependent protein deacylase n=1 Tax=Peptococcus simiae TaxID=1643805 RepID=UPI0039813658
MHPELKKLIETHDNIVFFGGAGVSTESGIPDFRSPDGLYSRKDFKYSPETMLSHSFYEAHTDEFFDFYRSFSLAPNNGPSCAHKKLAELEAQGKLKAVITQNIDGLHQMAGSKRVFELHGSVLRNYCTQCGTFYDLDFIAGTSGIPRCPKDNAVVKPDVVLYEESLDSTTLIESVRAIEAADMMIVAGTSLVVYPAAGLLDYFKGDTLVLINKEATPRDGKADLVIHAGIGETLCGD